MSKRHRSPDGDEPMKRIHTDDGPSQVSPRSGFDGLFYDELILVIFSHLSWSDLCRVQPTNRNWCRLSLDNQLWKALYLNEYGRSRLRGVRGFIGRGDGREIRPLPGRARTEDVRDWKWMFRISSNWRTGRCSIENFSTIPAGVGRHDAWDHVLPDVDSSRRHTNIILAGGVIITTSPLATTSPEVLLMSSGNPSVALPCPLVRTNDSIATVTSLALDQSQPSVHEHQHVRLVSLLSSGDFHLYSVNHLTPSSSHRLGTYTPSMTINLARVTPIIQSVYHHPLLVTLSQSFHLSLYDLTDPTHITHCQTLTSYTSYPPTSLVLSTVSPTTYKLVLSYAIPVYPAHWSVGATELIMRNDRGPFIGHHPTPTITVANSRSTKAFDIPAGWVDEQKMQAVKEQWSRKVSRVADTQTDGKWVILAPGDPFSSTRHMSTSLQLYRLHLPATATSFATPRMTFVRTLHGHLGPVSSLSVADGRCVSLGVDGSIWVWDLEAGTGAEVTSIHDEHEEEGLQADLHLGYGLLGKKGAVVFDERRIVTADARGLEVRRFDI
ncbi:hypothetical protein BXZ70DRAFT_948633 [Cristinia sonorae]|uniref:F-box domain-containing protein n=1 Tax=Cristinia sonorae TaxID=1940300 RepID=A0A8K0UJQ6_9AGAR|nr:hypothetical protein BXZ70DRAFT_948633 [Cristinia sonorae]